jgi:hypothetical protein
MQEAIFDDFLSFGFGVNSFYTDLIACVEADVLKVAIPCHVDKSKFIRTACVVTLFIRLFVLLNNDVMTERKHYHHVEHLTCVRKKQLRNGLVLNLL